VVVAPGQIGGVAGNTQPPDQLAIAVGDVDASWSGTVDVALLVALHAVGDAGLPAGQRVDDPAVAHPALAIDVERGAQPEAPSVISMREANGDVIIVLSDDAGFSPFAFPSAALRKVLVAMPSLQKYAFWPAAARSIAAHELGHALGLDHNDDATSLMCGG